MKSYQLLIVVSIFSTIAFGEARAFAGCKVPDGEAFYEVPATEESMITVDGVSRPLTDEEKVQYQIRTFLKPSEDCKSVRIWQTSGGSAKMPTKEQCAVLGGDFSPFPDFLGCNDYRVHKNEKDAAKAPIPRAYVAHDGTLVTRNSGGFSIVNGRYKLMNGKIQATYDFETPWKGAFPDATTGSTAGSKESGESGTKVIRQELFPPDDSGDCRDCVPPAVKVTAGAK